MGIGPITGIRGISLLKPSSEENSRLPAVSFEPSGRAGDDSFDSSNDAADHDLQKEQPDLEEESQAGESAGEHEKRESGEGDSRVNLFA